jgi:hypothetical protein
MKNKSFNHSKYGFNNTTGFFLSIVTGVAVLTAGCTLRQAYPETEISGYLNGQPFTIHAPKDSTLAGLDVVADTNGSIHVHIEHLQCSLNPTNLASAADGQAAIVNATGDAVNKAFSQALEAAAKSALTH